MEKLRTGYFSQLRRFVTGNNTVQSKISTIEELPSSSRKELRPFQPTRGADTHELTCSMEVGWLLWSSDDHLQEEIIQ